MLKFATNRQHQYSTKWNQYDATYTPLWVADMDIQVLPEIKHALKNVSNNETFGYTDTPSSTYDAVLQWCEKQYDWKIEQDWIVWLPGIVQAFFLVNQIFHHHGQTILIPSPNYPPLLNSAKNLGLSYQFVPHYYCDQTKHWHLDLNALSGLISQQNVSILSLANPANPLGYILEQKELSKLTSICETNNIIICSDEIHCDLRYKKQPHLPMGKVAPDHSITLMAASKTFNIAGLNTAFAIIPNPEIRKKFQKASMHRIGHPNLLGLIATETAFTKGQNWLTELLQYLQTNRDIIYDWGIENGLNNHYSPDATHLFWLQLPIHKFIDNNIMPSNGIDFGEENYNRINFACDRELLLHCLEKLSRDKKT